MTEAPKQIWAEHEYREWSFKPSDFEDGTETTQYIRADLVDGLVEALEGLLSCPDDPVEIMEKVIAAKKALAALKALEEAEIGRGME